jgi:hypothetical protein
MITVDDRLDDFRREKGEPDKASSHSSWGADASYLMIRVEYPKR